MNIRVYLVRRLALLVFVLTGIVVITFLVVRVMPSDPARLYLGGRARADQLAQAREELGLNKPLIIQFGIYVGDLVKGNWGESLRTRRPVLDEIRTFFPESFELICSAMLLAAVLGIALGVLSAVRKAHAFDHVSRILAIIGVSLPSFFLALVLQVIFFEKLNILPVAGQISVSVAQAHPVRTITGMLVVDSAIAGNFVAFWDALRHLILPTLALAAYPAGMVMRMTRSTMLEALESDYIKMARAMGVHNYYISFRYALKNSLPPVLTVFGLMIAYSLVGTFYVEQVFAWPGLGSYGTASILSLDFPAIIGVTIVVALAYVILNLVVDLLIVWIDPRVALS
jgi:peptide/nickel transport system permease protein